MTRILDILIPAAVGALPGLAVEHIAGKIVTCVTSTAAFKVAKDNGGRIDLNTGQDTGDNLAKEFGTLFFYNATNAQIVARVAVGYERYTPDRAVNATVNTTVTVSGKNAPTYTKGTNPVIIPAFNQAFNGVDGSNVRKSFSVFNTHATDDLNILAANGTLMHVCAARTGFVVESGGLITLSVPGAANITPAVCEVFYS